MQVSVKPAFWFVMSLFVVIIMTLPTQNDTSLSENMLDVYDLIGTMKQHENGVVLLGGDGVLRSFAPNHTVLAYAQLSLPQIKKLIDDYGRDDNLTKLFDGVNGHDVVDMETLTHPEGKDLLPTGVPSDHDAGVITHPSISEYPAAHDHVARVYAPENCAATSCYGLGNCGKYCTICIVPYPGYAGICR